MSAKPTWISEEEASKMMYYHPRYFRMLVKRGTLSVSYRKISERKGYEYDAKDIEQIKNKDAKIIVA
jgi:hypothetical protein